MASEGTGSLRQGGQSLYSAVPSAVIAKGVWAPGEAEPVGTQKLSGEKEATFSAANMGHGHGLVGSPPSCSPSLPVSHLTAVH